MAQPARVVTGVQVDRGSPVPLYYQVATRLQDLITSGTCTVPSS